MPTVNGIGGLGTSVACISSPQLWSSLLHEIEFDIARRMQQAADSFLREIPGSYENLAT
jgi:hypothetical protein